MTRLQKIDLLVMLSLFVLALALRLPGLGTFFTADEFLWVGRSRDFLEGLLNPNYTCMLPDQDQVEAVPGGQGLECTLRTGHPGVLTMWTGAAGMIGQWWLQAADDQSLLAFVQQLSNNPVDAVTIAPVRLPTVILTSLFVAFFFLLLRQMFPLWPAALAALLLGLNPFHLALSRVLHHDALSTIFIITASLCLMLYFGVQRKRRWLLLAGVLSGVAMLSKSTGFFLIPYAGLLALWAMLGTWARNEQPLGTAFRQTLVDGFTWAATTMAAFVAFWPAMWVIPGRALNVIFSIGTKYASGGHAKGVRFFDTVASDPGPFFYPVTWLFRTHAWVMLGLLLLLGITLQSLWRLWAARRPASGDHSRWQGLKAGIARLTPSGFDDRRGLLLWLAAFVFFFLLASTLNAKKQDRYILPIYPMLDVMAALGLVYILRKPWQHWAAVIGMVLLNLSLILPTAPYYFSYYNPLVGGLGRAAETITVGWGEGLNEAAAFLNQLPDIETQRAASWYGSTFAPYFKGETVRYSDQKGNALAGDYVVFYINQVQRNYPDTEIWDYVALRETQLHTVTVSGEPYAWVFSGPAIDHYVEDQVYTGIAALLAWEWRGTLQPEQVPVPAGSVLEIALFWEYLGKRADEPFFVRLRGPDGRVWAETTTRPITEFADSNAWRPGQILEETGTLTVPPDTPPGNYTLDLGFYTSAPAVPDGELRFPTPNAPLDAPLQVLTITTSAEVAPLRGRPALDLLLQEASPISVTTEALRFDVSWQKATVTTSAYQAAFALVDEGGATRWQWPARSLIEFLPVSDWPVAASLRSQWDLPLTPRTPGGPYHLNLLLSDEIGRQTALPLGSVTLPGRPRQFAVPANLVTAAATFGETIQLLGHRNLPSALQPGTTLQPELVWQALAPIETDYTLFLQVLDAANRVVAQQDVVPLAGAAPTTTWTPGEVLPDTYNLSLPPDLPPGEYRLIVGWYDPQTGQRVPTPGGDFVVLQVW